MRLEQNRRLYANARTLRKAMTKEERRIWYCFLRSLPIRFRRQQVIGNYIADFYCHEKRLVIELDGSQHYEGPGRQADRERDAYFCGQGLTVLRYSNADVNLRFRDVCEDVLAHLK